MGRGTKPGKQKHYTHAHTVGKTVERSIKRDELVTIASICGTKREVIGSVISFAIDTNEYDDGAAAANERATSESTTVDSEPSTSTV